MRRATEERDMQIVREMWTLANNEPLTLAPLVPFGFLDKERYRRYVDGLIVELTLDKDPSSGGWFYELVLKDSTGIPVDEDRIRYWLNLFFGREAPRASKRNFMMTDEARFLFPRK